MIIIPAVLLLVLSQLAYALPTEQTTRGITIAAQNDLSAPIDGPDARNEHDVQETTAVGGPHGTPFTDKSFATGPHHRRISSVTLFGCDGQQHITKFLLTWRDNHLAKDVKVESFHGTNEVGQPEASLKLAKDENIKEVHLRTWKAKFVFSRRTRIGWLKMITNQQHEVQCGAMSTTGTPIILQLNQQAKIDVVDPAFYWLYENYALLYISGLSGDALDSLSGHFIKTSDYF